VSGDGDATPPGTGDGDGDIDTTPPTPTDDAGESPPPDAEPGPVPGVTSVCVSLDANVVACFDFNGNLRDASRFGNDASGTATFEDAPMGKALRPNGKTIAVSDDDSLSSGEFTLEAWVRPDALVSLNNDDALLVDNDQQYILGINSKGEPFGEVYRAQEDSRKTTAAGDTLTVGEWVYLAYTFDGNTGRVYKDGQLIAENNVALTPFAGIGNPMHLGTGSPAATRPFDGLMDAVRISSVARSRSDICRAAGGTFNNGSCR
jgi:hypothetical protein